MKDIKEILAENLKYYRNRRKVSQEELAFKAGLHRTYISSIECQRRNISVENLSKIAEVLEIKPYILLKERSEIE